jgi:hypothetical protein
MGIISVEGFPILEVPLGNASVEGAGVQQKMVDIGLLILPNLGRGMLTQRIDEAVRVNHRYPFVYG